jgi:hypothetical protein
MQESLLDLKVNREREGEGERERERDSAETREQTDRNSSNQSKNAYREYQQECRKKEKYNIQSDSLFRAPQCYKFERE